MKRKDLLDSVIAPMRYVRPAPFRQLPQYQHVQEESKMISISSAGLKKNWWYQYTLSQIWIQCFGDKSGIQSKDEVCFMAFDYLTSLEHHIKTAKEIAAERKTSDYISLSFYLLGAPRLETAWWMFLNCWEALRDFQLQRKHETRLVVNV